MNITNGDKLINKGIKNVKVRKREDVLMNPLSSETKRNDRPSQHRSLHSVVDAAQATGLVVSPAGQGVVI